MKEAIFIPEENCNFKKYWINVKKELNKKDMFRKNKYIEARRKLLRYR